MLEMMRPEPKAALTWVVVWLAALIALAMVPVDNANSGLASMPDEIQYSHGTNPGLQRTSAPTPRVPG